MSKVGQTIPETSPSSHALRFALHSNLHCSKMKSFVRASYNGYYVSFPSLRRGFDSLRPHHLYNSPLCRQKKSADSSMRGRRLFYEVTLTQKHDQATVLSRSGGASLRRWTPAEPLKNLQDFAIRSRNSRYYSGERKHSSLPTGTW